MSSVRNTVEISDYEHNPAVNTSSEIGEKSRRKGLFLSYGGAKNILYLAGKNKGISFIADTIKKFHGESFRPTTISQQIFTQHSTNKRPRFGLEAVLKRQLLKRSMTSVILELVCDSLLNGVDKSLATRNSN